MSLLENLVRRVSRLERELALAKAGQNGGAHADQIVDSYAKVMPDGSIIFDFEGHIHAHGMDMDMHKWPPPTTDDAKQIRFIDPDTNLPGVTLFAAKDSGNEMRQYRVEVEPFDATKRTLIDLNPEDINLRVDSLPTVGTGKRSIRVSFKEDGGADSAEQIIIDSAYRSIFAKAANIVTGIAVDSDKVDGLHAAAFALAADFIAALNGLKRSVVQATFNPPSLGANTSTGYSVVLPAGSCNPGDTCMLMGRPEPSSANGILYFPNTGGRCQVADRGPVFARNVTAGAIDDPLMTFSFEIWKP